MENGQFGPGPCFGAEWSGYVPMATFAMLRGVTSSHLDASLVSQIQDAQFEYLRGRMDVMRDVRGDPGSTRYFKAEHVRACTAAGVPNPLFNQVFISGRPAQQDLESAFRLFDESGMTPQFEIGPGAISSELAQHLAGRGFIHTQSDPILVRSSSGGPQRSGSEIQIGCIDSEEAGDVFESTYVRAWQVETWLEPMLRSYVKRWLHVPGWTLYLARQEAIAVGVGVLFNSGSVGYLADAATIPEFRMRGVQSALISRRIVDACRSSARLVFSRAAFGTSSQRNLERAGLESRYTVSIWTRNEG